MSKHVRSIIWMMILLAIYVQPVFAHHRLRQDIDDLLGPLAWGMYLILPIPFIIIGAIAFLIWRAIRKETADGKRPWDSPEPFVDPKLN